MKMGWYTLLGFFFDHQPLLYFHMETLNVAGARVLNMLARPQNMAVEIIMSKIQYVQTKVMD